MSDTPQEAIGSAFGAVMFILAVSFTMMLFRSYGNFSQVVKEEIYDNGFFYEQVTDEEFTDSQVSYEEVMGLLMSYSLDYDVSVNGTLIKKLNYNYMKNNLPSIPRTDYKRSYMRDGSGEITRIVFVSN